GTVQEVRVGGGKGRGPSILARRHDHDRQSRQPPGGTARGWVRRVARDWNGSQERDAMTEDSAGRVIIVGGGPVGLGAALELARCGVRSVLIEKHDTTSWHPKTRNFNTRTME